MRGTSTRAMSFPSHALISKPNCERFITYSDDALIASCDILARNMAHRGENDLWRIQRGQDRKDIGDFACLLHAMLGLAAR